ncbi:hypothetical protein RHGRI_000268 [Rhododendron griersonianum]|uniref:C2 tensin-type domain-containing protein n=1 Tax=Rhododendron griersonianum TaxID=479676 RepID=A0AAV6LH30_9ERIC|nr:hypothetical protein RHGRI_000268 [Rhododendron griersonianum]
MVKECCFVLFSVFLPRTYFDDSSLAFFLLSTCTRSANFTSDSCILYVLVVFDCCVTTDAWEEIDYKVYIGRIIGQLRENYPDASMLVFNFREGETENQVANALSEKLYTGEQKTLDMIYKQAPRELLHLLSPLNPLPSQLRYLQYVSRRNVASEWPPLDRALTLDCVIIRLIPNFDGEGGDVVLECISLNDDMEREEMMFRVMFNTAFIRSNILNVNQDEIDIVWDAKDQFPKDFRAEVLFSDMDASASVVPVNLSCFEDKDGLPVEAFAKVQEIFSNVDWLGPKTDAALNVLHQITASNIAQEKPDTYSRPHQNAEVITLSHAASPEKQQEKQSFTRLGSYTEGSPKLASEDQPAPSSKLSPDRGEQNDEPDFLAISPQTPPPAPPLRPSISDSNGERIASPSSPLAPLHLSSSHLTHHSLSKQSETSLEGSRSCLVTSDNLSCPQSSHCEALDIASSTPPLPAVPLKENSAIQAKPPPPPPPPPPPTAPPSSTLPLKISSLDTGRTLPPPPPTTPPPPRTQLLKDTAATTGPCPPKRPPPNPPPPPSAMPLRGNQGVKIGSPSPPTPPPPPTPPVKDNSTIRVPSPPPPPTPSFSSKTLERSPQNSSSVPSAPPPPITSIKGSNAEKGLSRSLSPAPPTPAPPFSSSSSAKGRGLSRTISSRSNQMKKLKPLHWLKLTRAVQGSLWAEAQKSGEASKAPEIDMSELESLFSAAVPNPDQEGSGHRSGSRSSLVQKPEKVQLIEHRRAYNCEIMLSKVKVPLHQLMSSVLALEDAALDADQVDNLIKFCPTKEEMELLKIRNSVKFKRVMQTILSLGNALNQGTARGSAIGFRLDSLLKLTETRARNNKMTLMHYLCKIQLKYLAEEMQAVSKGLEKVVQELSESENDGPVSEEFRGMTNPYYEEAMSRKMAAVERERWEREHREKQKAYWAHWDKVEEERKGRVSYAMNPDLEEAHRQIAAASKRERETIDDDLAKLEACWDRCAQHEKNMYRTGVFEEPVGPPFPDEVDQAYSKYGGVCEMDMRKEKWWVDYDMCAKLAVQKYNSYFKGTRLGELKFIKTLKVSSQIAARMVFIVTFEAKHLTAVGANVRTYQTNVLTCGPSCDSYIEFNFGVVLLELIAGPKLVGKFGDRVDIVRWVKKTISELAQWVPTNKHHKPVQDCHHVRRQEAYDDGSRAHTHQSSSGYEVTISPRGGVYGGVLPMDMTKERRYQDYDMCAQLAINKYNSTFKEQLGLEFVKVLFVTGRISCFMTFYITFEAKDLADGGMVKTYQTEVLMGLREGVWNVRAMRLKPGLDEQALYTYLILTFFLFVFHFNKVAILKEDGSGKTRNVSTGFQEKGEGEEAVLQKVVITDMRSYTASWNISCKFSFRS